MLSQGLEFSLLLGRWSGRARGGPLFKKCLSVVLRDEAVKYAACVQIE